MIDGWPLDYWKSREWKNVQDKLDILDASGVLYNPERDDLFRSIRLCSLRDCRVAIFGQDPYPDPVYAHGVAFSAAKRVLDTGSAGCYVGEGISPKTPASLRTIFREYIRDLHPIGEPTTLSLEDWCDQGVLLWNVTPTIEIDWNEIDEKWDTWSHKYWSEWSVLTQEIVERLSAKGRVVFALCGSRAHSYAKYVDTKEDYNSVLYFSHPSPRGQSLAINKFVGSRFFTTINDRLVFHLQDTIDWRLP